MLWVLQLRCCLESRLKSWTQTAIGAGFLHLSECYDSCPQKLPSKQLLSVLELCSSQYIIAVSVMWVTVQNELCNILWYLLIVKPILPESKCFKMKFCYKNVKFKHFESFQIVDNSFLAYFLKMKVSLSNHQSVCVCVCPSLCPPLRILFHWSKYRINSSYIIPLVRTDV
jgi:hypothetical protein